jgi:hypothetical protein
VNPIKYQVFISSTYSDLVEERGSIIKAVLELYHIPIGMEMFSAEDEDQWEIIRRTIEVSDYYILVLGLRYGSKTSDGISFTQKEYEYALERKIPILAFVMDETVSLSKDRRDDDLTEVQSFRDTVLNNSKMAQFWKNKDELIKNVSISLTKQIMQKPGVGWVRGDRLGNEEALLKELTSLSKENRQLRDRVAELESTVIQKFPKIVLRIDAPEVDENFNAHDILAIPKEINFCAIDDHLKPYVSKDEIESYNRQIQCKVEIDKYNRECELVYKVKNYSIPLVIYVSNQGSLKASNIFIDIAFPDELVVYDKDKEFEEPRNPIPVSPLLMTKKYEKDLKWRKFVRETDGITPLKFSGFPNEMFSNEHRSVMRQMPFPMPKIAPINRRWWTRLNSNKLTIKMDDLLHTRCVTFDDEYRIAPLKSGKHKIEISVICEEYDACRKQIIEIDI